MNLSYIITLSLLSISVISMDLPVQGPRRLGNIRAHHDGHDFWVEKIKKNNVRQLYFVDRWRLCRVLRSINKEDLQELVRHGYLSASKNSAGEYGLSFQGRLLGGAWLAGEIGYWGTKVIAWGIISSGINTALKKVFSKDEPAYHSNVCPNSVSANANIANVSHPTDQPLSVIIPKLATNAVVAPVDWGPSMCMMKPVQKVVEHGIKNSGLSDNAASLTVGTMAVTGTGLHGFVEGLANGARWLGRLLPWF